jgi:hypothetical protein
MTQTRGPDRDAHPDACQAFEAVLPGYLEGTLTPGERTQAVAHLKECARCETLTRELENVRRQAAALPVRQPSRDLWAGIEARLVDHDRQRGTAPDAPVASTSGAHARARQRWFTARLPRRAWAMAAGLIVATATVTYFGTHWMEARTGVPGLRPTAETVAVNRRSPVLPPTARPESGAALSGPTVAATPVRVASHPSVSSTQLYDAQIAALRTIVEQRRGQLDSQTVAIIERNLAVIDTAIAQSKAALAKDPRSRFLADQLDHALDTKVELLRTVALLPSHT